MSRHVSRAHRLLEWALTVIVALSILSLSLGGQRAHLLAGLIGALAVLVTRARVDAPSAFVVGQVSLVAVLPPDFALLPVALGEGVLFGLLLLPDLTAPSHQRGAVYASLLLVPLLGGVWGTRNVWRQQWAVALTLVGIGGLIGYTLHRYEQVRLGVINDE